MFAEIRFVSAYRSVRQNERIMLKSPKAPRRAPLTPTAAHNSSTYTAHSEDEIANDVVMDVTINV